MRYIGTELDGKRMKAVAVEKGSRIGDYVYELNSEHIDNILDMIEDMDWEIWKLNTANTILRNQNDRFAEIVSNKAEGRMTGGPGDDYNHNLKKRGGHGD